MSQTDDLFLREDLGKPENRVNVALFGMMQQAWFREWFLKELSLPTDAVVYPPTDVNGYRPDLKVASHGKSTLAWIEVELGKDDFQAADYKDRFCEPVKTVCGKRSDGGDLSLEEIAEYLDACPRKDLSPQEAVNTEYLCKMIRDGLDGHKGSLGRDRVSDKMQKHPLVVGLKERLGDRLRFEVGRNQPPPDGCLKADTTEAGGTDNQGFSLRVYSPKATYKTLAVMSISGGRPYVSFRSLVKLKKYLPERLDAVECYASLLLRMGLDISKYSESARPSLPLNTVLAELDDLALCLVALAVIVEWDTHSP